LPLPQNFNSRNFTPKVETEGQLFRQPASELTPVGNSFAHLSNIVANQQSKTPQYSSNYAAINAKSSIFESSLTDKQSDKKMP
jgi:hypothetical protein